MKKLGKILAGVTCLACLGTAFLTGCGGKSEKEKEKDFVKELGGTSDTYKGELSKQTYASENAAAEAYVQEQVAGGQSVSVVNTTSKGVLSETEVSALNLPEEEKTGIVSVEEVEVEYSAYSAVKAMSIGSDSATSTQKVKVYIIKYDGYWKYFSPCPVTGETITKSYYDSVFDTDKYANCTVETSMDMEMSMKVSEDGYSVKISMDMGIDMTVLFSETAIYVEQTATLSMSMFGETEKEKATVCAYITWEEEDGVSQIRCWVKSDYTEDQWVEGDLSDIEISSIDELLPFANEYLDYTYFTKSDYGFALSDENAVQYVNEVMGEDLEEFGYFSDDIDIFAKYYVCNGLLSGMRMDMEMNINVVEDGVKIKGDITAVGETKVTDYGTTVVEKPF